MRFPSCHEATRSIPGDAVPVVKEVRHVEKLRGAQQFRRLHLVAPQLRDASINGIGIRRVLVLNDSDRHAVDDEHHVRTVPLSGLRLDFPFPRDVEGIDVRRVEVNESDGAVTILSLVVPLPLPAQPSEDLPIALNRRRECFESFDGGADGVVRHPRIELTKLRLKFAAEQRPCFTAALLYRGLRRECRPPDLHGVANHRKLDGTGLGYFEVIQRSPSQINHSGDLDTLLTLVI